MIVLRNLVLATAISLFSTLLSPQLANAFELTGVWATSADQCTKVFTRKGRANKVSFTNFRACMVAASSPIRSPERQV